MNFSLGEVWVWGAEERGERREGTFGVVWLGCLSVVGNAEGLTRNRVGKKEDERELEARNGGARCVCVMKLWVMYDV